MAKGQPIILGLGIAAGSPFTIGKYALIVATTPPAIADGRLGQLGDAEQSIVAPGLGGVVRTFVMGEDVGVGPGNQDSIYIGANIHGDPAGGVNSGNHQIIIGMDINHTTGNTQDCVLIGFGMTFVSGGFCASSVHIGQGQTLGASGLGTLNSVAIGATCQVRGGQSVAIGAAAVVEGEGVAIGFRATTGTSGQGIAIGKDANVAGGFQAPIAIGLQALAQSAFAIAIGHLANATADSAIAIGKSASVNFLANCIVLGRESLAALAGDFVVGNGVNFPTTRMMIGPLADTNATYGGLTWLLTRSNAGVDKVAPSFTMIGGSNTGAAAGGKIQFETGTVGASGAGQQVTAQRFAILPSTGAAGAGGEILQFSNYTDGAAAGVQTFTNAPATAATAEYIPVLNAAGQLRYLILLAP